MEVTKYNNNKTHRQGKLQNGNLQSGCRLFLFTLCVPAGFGIGLFNQTKDRIHRRHRKIGQLHHQNPRRPPGHNQFQHFFLYRPVFAVIHLLDPVFLFDQGRAGKRICVGRDS